MPLAPNSDAKQDKAGPALVLGIESSCDETAASVLRRHANGKIEILSSIIASQVKEHSPFGGVVPEIAARAHMLKLDGIIDQAVTDADIDFTDLSAIAATAGPGLVGGVIAGLLAAKGLALSLDIPLVAVNHLEGHALSPRLASPCPFPYLLLLVSGGHTQLLSVKGLGDYERLGSTVDDAAGEAFDKTAKVMGLGFPGGPNVERVARDGNPEAVALPRPFRGKPHADFSFAGLKTAVKRAFEASDKSDKAKADISASFQRVVAEVLTERTTRAMDMFRASLDPDMAQDQQWFVIAGGVAANSEIRTAFEKLCAARRFDLILPPHIYCTDNAAMIALAGAEHYVKGNYSDLATKARPRWPLDARAARDNPASGFGKRGPKS